jgi:hypothetical protein
MPAKPSPPKIKKEPVDPRHVVIARLIWRRHKANWMARIKRFFYPPKV